MNQLESTSGCAKPLRGKICQCIFHQIFFGEFRSTVTCSECSNVTVAKEPFIDLSLDIQRQVQRQRLDQNLQEVKMELDISVCLKDFTRLEQLPVWEYRCESEDCGGTGRMATKHVTMKILPPTLCLHIKVSLALSIVQTRER